MDKIKNELIKDMTKCLEGNGQAAPYHWVEYGYDTAKGGFYREEHCPNSYHPSKIDEESLKYINVYSNKRTDK